MSAQHTPGPWKKEHGSGPLFEATETDAAQCVAVLGDDWFVYSLSSNFGDAEKDASLITYAPDLLVAAALALDWMRDHGATLETMAPLHAAIAKALGEAQP